MNFKWDTVHLCSSRGCKTSGGQIWSSEKNVCMSGYIFYPFLGPPTLTSDSFAIPHAKRMHYISFKTPYKCSILLRDNSIYKVWNLHLKCPHLCRGSFTNYVMHFPSLFDHPPTYGYVFLMILLNIYLIKFAMVIFCWPPAHLNDITQFVNSP